MCFQKNHKQNSSKIEFFNLTKWIDTLAVKRVLLVSNRDMAIRPFLYGEDYYIHSVAMEFEKNKIPVNFAILHRNKIKFQSVNMHNIDKIPDETLVILHNVSPFWVFKAKIKKKIKVVMPIYLIYKNVSLYTKIKGKIGCLLWQLIVDEYLVSAPILAERLRKLGIIRRISILPPKYICTYCDYTENLRKKTELKKRLPNMVEAVYIGSMLQKRFPLTQIIENLNRDGQRKYNLKIYTASQVKEEAYQKGNVQVTIIRKKLSDEEKCKILRESHVFLAPAMGTTMVPSISVMEAEYHGNIVIRF